MIEERGVADGTAGLAYAMWPTRPMSSGSRAELVAQLATRRTDRPGLLDGAAGVAWVLAELGAADQAEAFWIAAMRATRASARGDVLSGTGLTALLLYLRTGRRLYLEQARWIGGCLAATADDVETGRVAFDQSSTAIGCVRHAARPATFLLYLYLASGNWKWLALGRRALEADCAAILLGDPVAFDSCDASIAATILARYYAVLGTNEYRLALRRLVDHLGDRAASASASDLLETAHIGQSSLDCALLCRSRSAERLARSCATRIVRAGRESLKAMVDTCACAVASFVSRAEARRTSAFMLDELIDIPGACAL